MTDDKNPTDASKQAETQAAALAAAEAAKAPKFEFKDGVMVVNGKKVVYEHELIAAKKNLEQSIESAQTVHNEAIDKAKLDLSATQTQLAAANAKVKEMETARTTGAMSDADTAKQKADLEKAKAEALNATNSVLEFRKKNVVLQYNGVTLEQLKDKTSAQLDALEEALKAIASHGGLGPYAIGGGAGGTTTLSEDDRAKAILARIPFRGTREAVSQK